jgi:hypothetical protein
MSYVARWSVEVQFGRKPELFASADKFQKWASDKGWPSPRVLVNAIGGSEARVEFEYVVDSLAELEKLWGVLPHDDTFKVWQKEIGGLVVPGSPRWEVWRIQKG